jgi:hypothetical protein
LNFTFGTTDLVGLWRLVQAVVYQDRTIAAAMQMASIATCEGEHGWDDYLLLFHVDPAVRRDPL